MVYGPYTLGRTDPADERSAQADPAGLWCGSDPLQVPEEMWVDSIWFYIAAHDANRTSQGCLYWTNGYMAGGATEQNTLIQTSMFQGLLYALNSGNNNGGGDSPYLHLNVNDWVMPGMWVSGSSIIGGDGDAGGHYWYKTASSLPSNWLNMDLDKYGWCGDPHYYIRYWKKVAIYWLPSEPLAIGQEFLIGGRSFTAGINDIKINGVSVGSGYSVQSDTAIYCTVPSGASSGYVYIDSHAGTVTSTQALQIGPGGWYKSGGTIHQLKGGWYKSGGVLHPLKGGWYKINDTIHPLK